MAASAEAGEVVGKMAKVLIIIAPENYQDKEFEETKEVIEKAGYQVEVASKYKGLAEGKLGGSYQVDKALREVVVDNYDGLVFIGGPGAAIYINDEEAHQIARIANSENKAVGAICMAPSILANAGILTGRRVTVFPSEEDNLRAKGAEIISSDVTVDGKIVTGSGPYAAKEFAYAFLDTLVK